MQNNHINREFVFLVFLLFCFVWLVYDNIFVERVNFKKYKDSK